MGLLFWAGLGAVVGNVVAERRGFSPALGILAGLVLGPLVVVLFFVPVGVSNAVHRHKCPYCAGWVTSTARVCTHCRAILTSGWG